MEHTGRIWLGEDDPSSATQATVDVSSDGRVVIHVGESLVADWNLADVVFVSDDVTTELSVGDDRLVFDPDDTEAWANEVSATRMRARLQGGETQIEQGSDGPAVTDDVEATVMREAQPVDEVPTPTNVVLVAGTYCRACGSPIDPRADICVHCGVWQHQLAVRPAKSRITAGLLALFLGGLGAHHFYLGQTGLGILYLLFFWTFIPAFIAFFEALVFFFSSDASFDAKYNRA